MDKNENTGNEKPGYRPPEGSRRVHSIGLPGGKLDYELEADWIVLRKDEKPRAEMFFIRYAAAEAEKDRPVTFVFNGGPGASSAYLHLGAIGPRRVVFTDDGDAPPPPWKLADNMETWLAFTDLVFIDPVGTGFSRIIDDKAEDGPKQQGGRTDAESGGAQDSVGEYWKLKRDLESLSEFMSKYLSRYGLWQHPVYIAGESYGGFRAARLARMLQKDYGVGLSGAVIISPALEFSLLNASDYDVLPWVDAFPSMAAAAAFHGLSRSLRQGESMDDYRARAAGFALEKLLPLLASGDIIPEKKRNAVLSEAAAFTGLPKETLRQNGGRTSIEYYARNLLRGRGRLVGLYDASRSVDDPYPDRDRSEGPDPTLDSLERIFSAGINTQLRAAAGLQTERDYSLISMKVNESWSIDTGRHALDTHIGSVDELRYGMSLNPDMKVFICHGIYDLVTPAFSSERLAAQMRLSARQKKKLELRTYSGGHMFYTWDESRKAFYRDIRDFYSRRDTDYQG